MDQINLPNIKLVKKYTKKPNRNLYKESSEQYEAKSKIIFLI